MALGKLILICPRLLEAGVVKDSAADDDVVWFISCRGIPSSQLPDAIDSEGDQPISKQERDQHSVASDLRSEKLNHTNTFCDRPEVLWDCIGVCTLLSERPGWPSRKSATLLKETMDRKAFESLVQDAIHDLPQLFKDK